MEAATTQTKAKATIRAYKYVLCAVGIDCLATIDYDREMQKNVKQTEIPILGGTLTTCDRQEITVAGR